MKKLFIIIIAFLGCMNLSVKAQSNSNYKIVNKIHLDGNGGWDYLFSDDAAARLYVSHDDRVHVIDLENGKVIGAISNLDGVHGIAIDSLLNRGFISTKRDNKVTIFDTKTLNVIKKVDIPGKSPDAIMYETFSKKIIVANGHSDNISVLDPKTGEVVKNIALTGNPEAMVSDGKGKIYVNLESESKIAVINASDFKVEKVWSLNPGEGPTGLAFDDSTHRLFSVCANKTMVIVDANSGQIITTLPIAGDPDGAGFDPESKLAFASCKNGKLTIVQEKNADTFVVLDNLTTMYGAKTMTLNKLTHHIYTSAADFKADATGKLQRMPGTFVVLDMMPAMP